MSLRTNLENLITAIGTDWKGIWAKIGNSSLTTTAQTITGAINELDAASGASINDGATGSGTTWSSTKIAADIAAAKAAAKSELINGASTAYDTFTELQALMEADDTEAAGFATALATLNTNLGDVTIDLAALYATAKA